MREMLSDVGALEEPSAVAAKDRSPHVIDLGRCVYELREERLLVPSKHVLRLVREENPNRLYTLVDNFTKHCCCKLLDLDPVEAGPASVAMVERCAESYGQVLFAIQEVELAAESSPPAMASTAAGRPAATTVTEGDNQLKVPRQSCIKLKRQRSAIAVSVCMFSSRDFLQHVRIAPWGVIGNQLKTTKEMSRRVGLKHIEEDVKRAAFPDSSMAVLDFVPLSVVHTLGPIGANGTVAQKLYHSVGLSREPSFPNEVRNALQGEGDAKLYQYNNAVIIHATVPWSVVGPGAYRTQIVRGLAKVYGNIMTEFASSNLDKLRIAPIDDATVGDDLPDLTAEALAVGFMQLSENDQRRIMASTVELCILLESEHPTFVRALRQRPKPTPTFDAVCMIVNRCVQQGIRWAAEDSSFAKEKGGAQTLALLVDEELTSLFQSKCFGARSQGQRPTRKGMKLDGFGGGKEAESAHLAAKVDAELGNRLKTAAQLISRLNQDFTQLEAKLKRSDKPQEETVAPAEKPPAKESKDDFEKDSSAAISALISGFKAGLSPRRHQLRQVGIHEMASARSTMMSLLLPCRKEALRSLEVVRSLQEGERDRPPRKVARPRDTKTASTMPQFVPIMPTTPRVPAASSSISTAHEWALCRRRKPNQGYERLPPLPTTLHHF